MWGRQLSLLEKSCVHNPWVGQIKHQPGLQSLHLQAVEKCKRTFQRSSEKPIGHRCFPPHRTPPLLAKHSQKGANEIFPTLWFQWYFFSSHFCFFFSLPVPLPCLLSPFCMIVFCVTTHHFLFLSPSFPLDTCCSLHGPWIPSCLSAPCLPLLLPREALHCVSCMIPSLHYLLRRGCGFVILHVPRKALGHKVETSPNTTPRRTPKGLLLETNRSLVAMNSGSYAD